MAAVVVLVCLAKVYHVDTLTPRYHAAEMDVMSTPRHTSILNVSSGGGDGLGLFGKNAYACNVSCFLCI